jgi:hypothetical protein
MRLLLAAVLLCLAGCGLPDISEEPLARPSGKGARVDGTPLPAFATVVGGPGPSFAGPDPAAPEGDKAADVPPEDLKPAGEKAAASKS